MSNEFRIFLPTENFIFSDLKFIFTEKRSDLYILFTELPKELLISFGLKFRDISYSKNEITGSCLELKLMKKSNSNGVEFWEKVLSTYFPKPLVILEEKMKKNETPFFLGETPLKFNKKEIFEHIVLNCKFDFIKKLGSDPVISLALISKARKQSNCFSYKFEKTLIRFQAIILKPSPEKKFISFCVEKFKADSIENLAAFQEKWKKLNQEYNISPKNIKGYPEFILDNI